MLPAMALPPDHEALTRVPDGHDSLPLLPLRQRLGVTLLVCGLSRQKLLRRLLAERAATPPVHTETNPSRDSSHTTSATQMQGRNDSITARATAGG